MTLVVGLGNPGYENTRHNTGFMVIDKLATAYNINMLAKHKSLMGSYNSLILAKPQTYMNLSGESVLQITKYHNIEQLIVIYDDVALNLGRIKISTSGSSGGHNGVKNIIEHLKTDAFLRVRVGIGKPTCELSNYVLGKFTNDEREKLDDVIENACKAVNLLIENKIAEAMNKYNVR